MVTRRLSGYRPSRRFRFDYDPSSEEESGQIGSVDDIVASMNRRSQTGRVLDDVNGAGSRLDTMSFGGDGRAGKARGKTVFGLMLGLGLVVVWFYGAMEDVFQMSMLTSDVPLFGQLVPAWMAIVGFSLVLMVVRTGTKRMMRRPILTMTED